ncbi:MAG: hypothetical protein ACKO96_43335 [Flammeovirgaceae bacterium]
MCQKIAANGRGLYAVALPVEVKVKKFRYTIIITPIAQSVAENLFSTRWPTTYFSYR